VTMGKMEGGTRGGLAHRTYGALSRSEDTVDEGILRQLRRSVKIELRHDLRFMKLDRLRREIEGRCDLLDGHPFGNELQYFSLAGRQGLVLQGRRPTPADDRLHQTLRNQGGDVTLSVHDRLDRLA